MKKITLFFILLAIGAIGLLVAYSFVEEWRTPIGDTLAIGRDFITGQFTAFSLWFQTLPYWPVLGMGITFALGILFWWKIDTIQHAIYFWGYNKTVQPIYRDKPTEEPPRAIRPTPQTPPPLLEQKKELAE